MLNTTPVLDKGIVSLVSSSLDDTSFNSLQTQLNNIHLDITKLEDTAYASIYIKCPLFVQLHLSKFNLKIDQLPFNGEPEAYIPDETVISTGDNELNRVISSDIKQTTESLLINPKAYQHDGCNRFISQTITPISVYNSFMISGSLTEWNKFISDSQLPLPIEQYRLAVFELLKAEWRHLGGTKKNKTDGKEQ